MVKPKINVDEVVSEIKENLEIIKSIDKDNLTKGELAMFKKEILEVRDLALAIKKKRS